MGIPCREWFLGCCPLVLARWRKEAYRASETSIGTRNFHNSFTSKKISSGRHWLTATVREGRTTVLPLINMLGGCTARQAPANSICHITIIKRWHHTWRYIIIHDNNPRRVITPEPDKQSISTNAFAILRICIYANHLPIS